MKKAIATLMISTGLASAGVVKVALFPLHHPKKDFHAAKKVVKAVAKAAYNL